MIALIYKKIVDFRNLMYDKKKFKSYKSKIPIVSVGNITAGGTGKTPFVVSLVKYFRGRGLNPLIVSRGYGRKTKKQIVFNLKSEKAVEEVGDEPILMSLLCPKTDIVVNKNRVEAVRWAETSSKKYDVIVLDDGFQHRAIHRDFNILLINAEQNLSECLPKGELREPLKNIKRADCIVFTKSCSLANVPGAIADSNIPMFKSRELFALSNTEYSCGVAFCGIGSPSSFIKTLDKLSVKIVDKIYFRDHQQYNDRAIEKIEELLKQNNQRVFYTTQKDWIKLPPAFLKKYHGVYVEMDVFVDDLEFQNLLLKKIE